MVVSVLWILSIFGVLPYVTAVCETFSTACPVALGQRLPTSAGLTYASVPADEEYYITFTIPANIPSAMIDLSVVFGSVRIYAAVNRKPTPTSFDFTNALSGQQDSLSISSNSHQEADSFNVLIKASPASAALFTGSVVTSGSVLRMEVDGMPQTLRMGRASSMQVQFVPRNDAPVNVVSTGYTAYLPSMQLLYYPTAGSPAPVPVPAERFAEDNDPEDHYLSFTPLPAEVGRTFVLQLNAANASHLSVALRHGATPDDVTITGAAIQDPPATGAPTHTVVLLSGQPQRDQVGEQQEHYYALYVAPGITGAVTIRVDPIMGDSDLFVNPPSRGFYHREGNDPLPVWSSQRASGADSVTIQRNDHNYLFAGGAYLITVFGYDAAQFLVRGSVQDAATLLVEGYTLQDSVDKGTYKYYRFEDSDPANAVYFDLLPTVGDADLMVGCFLSPTGTDAGYPSRLTGHYNFTSEMYLEDTIKVEAGDRHSCSYSAASTGEGRVGGTFYLAVYGYNDATFVLSAQHAFGEKVLVPGQPASGVVFRAVSLRYKVRIGYEAEELRLLLSPLYGDADLYVRLGVPPDLTNYDYQSNNFNSEVDTITISESQICSDCWVHVLVYGFATTEFSLLATLADGTVSLSNGVPQRGSVGSGDIEYYNYIAAGDCSLTLVVTTTSGLVPALYMSKTVEKPTSTSPDTVVRSADSGLGVLPRVVLPAIHRGDAVHIGVDGAGKNISYWIRVYETPTAAGQPPTMLQLSDGVPQEDAIPNDAPTSWLYYAVSAPAGHETIRLRTVAEVGYVELYVTKCTITTSQCIAGGGLPSETNFLLTTADTDRDFLNIYRNDPSSTTYIVGVESQSFYAAYQISASFENSVLALQAGVAVMDHVGKDEVDYFSFFLDQPFVKLTISVTTMAGDPDLFVSTTVTRPAADDRNSTWRSTEYGPDTLTIDPRTDPKACVHCTYYIAVVGRRESSYTITASFTTGLPKLVDGVPTAGSVEVYAWAYYTFHNVYGGARDLHVALTSGTGNADLYVTLDGSLPTLTNHQYGSANWFSNDGVDILHSDSAYRTSCTASSGVANCMVIVGVYGFQASEYTLSLTSSSAALLLQLGTVVTDAVEISQLNYYRVLPGQTGTAAPYALRFTVTPFSGHVRLYVSCDNMQPNATSHHWSLIPTPGSGSTLEILSVAAADKGCLAVGAQYYASVYGNTASSYSISARIANDPTVPLLVPGLAHSGTVSTRGFDYYFVRPGNMYDDLRLLATVFQGDVDLYLSASWDTRPQLGPNGAVQSYLRSSAKLGSEDMLLDHDWVQTVCVGRASCYIIVGVYGVGSTNTYSLQSASKDATLQLSSGVPRRSHVSAGRIEYFKFTLSQPELDVVVSVTPISGDPDLFISMYPVVHPTRTNFTWFQSKFGADSVTLQYGEMSKHCVPRPTVVGGDCDIYIGVYGWMNTTFTIMAAVDEGFRSPITLIDQSPQSGHVGDGAYTYYRYSISVAQGAAGTPPTDIKFTLTPTDDGDADLFLLIEPQGNKTEPGLMNYNYRSTGWGSVTELIEISADMPFYCLDCTVFLAVYGYRACSYSLQASSSGLIALQSGQAIGGHVANERFAYYTIRNTNQFAIMKFTLTMISEDADLYIMAHKPGKPFELPTKTHYQWRSLFVGSDAVTVTYEDPQYCVDCDYLVGVYGYHNSTYTLMVTDQEDTIIKLVQNRPQIASIGAKDGILFFSAVIASSTADMTVTLTSLGTGFADLYVAVYNATTFNSPSGGDVYRLPDARYPSTYQYTTAHTEDDHVFIPGPHKEESIVIILVQAASAVRFSIVATSSQSAVLLLPGVPQSHYVEFGATEYFKFYPHADEDLHITLTARSGDPDLLVSASSPIPHCARVTNAYYTSTVCSNYTWSSRNYMTDQLIISRDSPCTAVMPGTTVSLDCDPAHSYSPTTGSPVYIGIYGYSSAQFNLLVAPVGQQVQLLAGQPQLSRTSTGFICTARSASTGACTTPASANKKVEAAYFAFRVSASSTGRMIASSSQRNLMEATSNAVEPYSASAMQSVFDVMISVVPACNASRLPDNGDPPNPALCAPGCDCAPLQVYVNSCPLSKCTMADRKPSEYYGQHKLVQTVKQGTGSSIVLSAATAGGYETFCDPAVAGQDCAYFVAVVATPLPPLTTGGSPRLESASFTITARTPGDMVLIPCVGDAFPDGIQFDGGDTILPPQAGDSRQHRPSHHYYEVCSRQYLPSSQTSPESLIVELEQCSGRTSLYACADDNHCSDVLPTDKSWGYFADSTQSCTHSWDARVRDTCISAVRGKPSLTLPQRVGNYFLKANGTGKFELRVQSTTNQVKTSPQVVFVGSQGLEASVVTVQGVTGNSVTLQWQQARVLMPGLYNPLTADFMTYVAYIFDARAADSALQSLAAQGVRDIRFNSACGLAYAEQVLPAAAVILGRATVSGKQKGEEFMSHTFKGLASTTYYRVVLVATCDSACLRQLSKITLDPHLTISCNDKIGECRTQTVVYTSASFTTLQSADHITDDDAGTSTDSTFMQSYVTLSIVLMVLLSVALLGVVGYYLKNNYADVVTFCSELVTSSTATRSSLWDASDDMDTSTSGGDSARSTHGLTAQNSGESRRSFTGFASLPKVNLGKKDRADHNKQGEGVELENLSYAPPSLGGSSAGGSGKGSQEPIDFRAAGEAISNVANKLYSAASSAYASATAPSIHSAAQNPLHHAQVRAASVKAGYSVLPAHQARSAEPSNEDEVELHL